MLGVGHCMRVKYQRDSRPIRRGLLILKYLLTRPKPWNKHKFRNSKGLSWLQGSFFDTRAPPHWLLRCCFQQALQINRNCLYKQGESPIDITILEVKREGVCEWHIDVHFEEKEVLRISRKRLSECMDGELVSWPRIERGMLLPCV